MNNTNQLRQRLLDAATINVSAGIEDLRKSTTDSEGSMTPTPEQLRDLRDGLLGLWSVSEILERTGFTEDTMCNAISKFGTYLAHAHGRAGILVKDEKKNGKTKKAQVHFTEDLPQLPLFLNALGMAGKKRQHELDKTLRPTKRNPVPADWLVLDGSWRAVLAKRDVKASIAAIVSARPSNSEIVRHITRAYQETSDELTFGHVGVVWWLAHLGRLDEIGTVADDRGFRTAAVIAYDMIETGRRDAMRAMIQFIGDQPLADPLGILEAMRPLWDAEVARLERLAESVTAEGNDAFERERGYWRRNVAVNPDLYVYGNIGDLNNGQIHRLAAAGGLDIDREEKRAEAQIRAGLQERDLNKDADVFIQPGLRAWRAGALDEFWVAVGRYADGDDNWMAYLNERIEMASAA